LVLGNDHFIGDFRHWFKTYAKFGNKVSLSVQVQKRDLAGEPINLLSNDIVCNADVHAGKVRRYSQLRDEAQALIQAARLAVHDTV